MSLVKCKICAKDVIETAARCPHCDSLGPKKSRRVTWVMVGVLILLAGAGGWIIYNRTQERVKSRDEIQAERRAEKIHQRVMSASFLLKTSVADPSAVQIDSIKTNIDGSVLCYQYSMKEQGGKPQQKKAVFTEGNFHHSGGSWGIYCVDKNLMDLPEKPQTD